MQNNILLFNYKGFKHSHTINGKFILKNTELQKSVTVTLDNLQDGSIYSIIDFCEKYQ